MRTIPLKRLVTLVPGQSPPFADVADYAGEGLPFLQGNAEFGLMYPDAQKRCDSASRRSRPQDILLSIRAPVGALNLSDQEYGIGRGLCAVRPADIDPRFCWWLLHAMSDELAAMSVGSTYDAVTGEDVGTLRVRSWPAPDQRAIADYLDVEVARIDALIDKKLRMIALLEERFRVARDAIIDRCGENKVPLRRFVTEITQGISPQAENTPANDDEWGLLKLSAVKSGRFIPSENKRLHRDYAVNIGLRPKPGDLLVTRSNTPSYVGDACAVVEAPGQVVLCDLIYRLRLDERMDPEFVASSLLTMRSRAHLSSAARGTSQSMVKLRGEDVTATLVPFVGQETQRRTLGAIARCRALRDEHVVRLTRQLDLLAERRQALITAAVTGELDVRGRVA